MFPGTSWSGRMPKLSGNISAIFVPLTNPLFRLSPQGPPEDMGRHVMIAGRLYNSLRVIRPALMQAN
eukprot:7282502-Pyramimonas_sp.AAC.1